MVKYRFVGIPLEEVGTRPKELNNILEKSGMAIYADTEQSVEVRELNVENVTISFSVKVDLLRSK